jgi:aminoglycoside phosphotransferase (APT) family kinase protein
VEEADLEALASSFGLASPARWTELRAHRGKSIWRVDCPDGRFVARVLRPDDHESADHEMRMMRLARSAGLPVARPVASVRMGARPVLLLEWTPGRELTREIHNRPWSALRLGELFGEQQAQIHQSRLEDAPSADWIDCFGPVDAPMRDRLEQVQRRPALLHLDYYPANLIFASGRLSGILDWTNARIGDPRADLARTWALMKFLFRAGRRRPVRRLSDDLFARGWWRAHERAAGPQDEVALFRAWALFGLIREKGRRHEPALERLERELREQAGLPPVGDLNSGGS